MSGRSPYQPSWRTTVAPEENGDTRRQALQAGMTASPRREDRQKNQSLRRQALVRNAKKLGQPRNQAAETARGEADPRRDGASHCVDQTAGPAGGPLSATP